MIKVKLCTSTKTVYLWGAMKFAKSVGLLIFTSFLFLGVCGISVSEHFCKFSEDFCKSKLVEEFIEEADHHCCEISTTKSKKENDDDCCEDESKIFLTSLNHYHDVLVKVPQVLLINTLKQTKIVANKQLNLLYTFSTYPNPPPKEQHVFRSFIQVYTL